MEDKDESLLGGSLGYFWEDVRSGKSSNGKVSGFLKRLNDGNVQLDYFLDLDSAWRDGYALPKCIYGATVNGRVLLLDLIQSRVTRRTNELPSVRTQVAGTAILGATPEHVKRDAVTSVSVFFPGVTHWAGMQTVSEESQSDDEGRGKSVSLHVEGAPRQECRLSQGRTISIASHWKLGGDVDDRSIFAPVSLECSTRRAQAFRDLLDPLMRVQDILNIAYAGFVPARGGRVRFATNESPLVHPRVWCARIMQVPDGVTTPKSMTATPMFSLAHIGGIRGLARWVKYCDQVPRVHRALSLGYRIGMANVEARFLEVASAIEYWVALQDQAGLKWAQEKRRPLALARHVGREFAEWIGDPQDWDSVFAGTYNAVKHDPKFSPDPYALSYLAGSGWLLLLSDVLNRVSGTKLPGKVVIGSHRNSDLGRKVHELLSDPSSSVKRREEPRRKRRRRA
ncbi:ApeA N-terminal domain 1-containing protein [Streptomyces hirsutus]|uniref:ApeA N-terminal domain 1-containing protein n=1 Tax=Streptomyces hirsutus TaxID=35620 RepID=UPI0036579247